MRRKIVVGNWKMNMTRAQAEACVEALVGQIERDNVDVGICPPYPSLYAVQHNLRGSRIMLGAQDVFWAESGAFTGRVSPSMIGDAGCTLCIVGHSETRGRFGKLEVPESTLGFFAETNETINLKIKALLYHSITPILCVGETKPERDADQTDSVIAEQLEGALGGVEADEFRDAVIAYEPVWAIGTGLTCHAAEAERVCGVIRGCLAYLLGEAASESIRIQYGGSVKPDNARELFSKPNIDGALVGGASLKASDFAEIVHHAAS